MEIVISTLEKAVADGISLLCRCRFHRTAPFYLVWPYRPLQVKVASMSDSKSGIRTAVAYVTCRSWSASDSTIVRLTLTEHLGFWRLHGPFSITYGPDYPVASLANRDTDTKDIYPMNMLRPDAARPMEYRIRSRAR